MFRKRDTSPKRQRGNDFCFSLADASGTFSHGLGWGGPFRRFGAESSALRNGYRARTCVASPAPQAPGNCPPPTGPKRPVGESATLRACVGGFIRQL